MTGDWHENRDALYHMPHHRIFDFWCKRDPRESAAMHNFRVRTAASPAHVFDPYYQHPLAPENMNNFGEWRDRHCIEGYNVRQLSYDQPSDCGNVQQLPFATIRPITTPISLAELPISGAANSWVRFCVASAAVEILCLA